MQIFYTCFLCFPVLVFYLDEMIYSEAWSDKCLSCLLCTLRCFVKEPAATTSCFKELIRSVYVHNSVVCFTPKVPSELILISISWIRFLGKASYRHYWGYEIVLPPDVVITVPLHIAGLLYRIYLSSLKFRI